jgi:hypothetical protein
MPAEVKHPELKKTFFILADKWTARATKLENAHHQRRASAILRRAPPA